MVGNKREVMHYSPTLKEIIYPLGLAFLGVALVTGGALAYAHYNEPSRNPINEPRIEKSTEGLVSKLN
jgi:hypothetical protein